MPPPPYPAVHVLRPRHHPCPGWYGDCFVGAHQLICGPGTGGEIPTLVVVERVETAGEEDPIHVVWSFAAGRARVDHPGGTVLLDEFGRRVDWLDVETNRWTHESLDSYEAYVDSVAGWTLDHSSPLDPIFEPAGEMALVAEFECLPFRLTMETASDDDRTVQIAQEIWVSRDVEMTEEIYTTYRHALRLFDDHWSVVPVERPPGILLRTREVRLTKPPAPGESAAIEDATVEEIGYRLYPITHFMSGVYEKQGPIVDGTGR